MTDKLLSEQHLEFLSLAGLSDSIHVKMPHCWKSHVAAHFCEIIMNLDHIVEQSGTIQTILVEGLRRNICVKLF